MAGKPKGQVMVAFKPEAAEADLERLLRQYQHEKTFVNLKYDPAASREEQLLARLYMFYTLEGEETELMDELNKKYASLVEYAEKSAPRKLIRSKP